MPEDEAKRYDGRVKGGGIIFSVHCDTSSEIRRAKDLLKESGASAIASSGEKAAAKDDATTEDYHAVTRDGIY